MIANQTDSRQVSITKPWLMVVMVDGSHSMGADWGDTKRSMSDIVEQAVNQLLYDMALNFNHGDEDGSDITKDRIHLRMMIYNGEDEVVNPIRVSNGSEYLNAPGDDGWVQNYIDLHTYPSQPGSIEIPRWFELNPHGRTPMLKAFEAAKVVVQQHLNDHPDSFPPVILNVSDGEPTDCGDPVEWDLLVSKCDEIRALSSEKEPIICNVHLDPLGRDLPSLYPASPPSLDGLESGLWQISSKIPEELNSIIPGDVESGERRFFVFNSDLIRFHEFLHFSSLLSGSVTPIPNPLILDYDPLLVIDIDATEEE